MTEEEFKEMEQAERQKHDDKLKELREETNRQKAFYNQLKACYNEEIDKEIELKQKIKSLEEENGELWGKVSATEEEIEKLKRINSALTRENEQLKNGSLFLELTGKIKEQAETINNLKCCGNCDKYTKPDKCWSMSKNITCSAWEMTKK